jgi:hypothetical protein
MTANDLPIAYVPGRDRQRETADQLRARIPGWGVDLDPADRPSTPKLQFREDLTGAHWEFPERQPETWPGSARSSTTHGGLSSRLGRRRTDPVHQPLDPVVVAGPWVVAVAGAVLGVRKLVRALVR